MAIYKDANGALYDDMDGDALSLSSWPSGLVKLTNAEMEAAYSPSISLQEVERIVDAKIDAYIDSVAESRGYRRVGVTPSASCVGYASYPNPYQVEAIAYGQWMAGNWPLVFAYRAEVEAQIAAGTRAFPSTVADAEALADEFVAHLQVVHPMAWPA